MPHFGRCIYTGNGQFGNCVSKLNSGGFTGRQIFHLTVARISADVFGFVGDNIYERSVWVIHRFFGSNVRIGTGLTQSAGVNGHFRFYGRVFK